MMTWLAFGGAAFRGPAFAFGALTATSTRTAAELDAAPDASTKTVGAFAAFAFALAIFPARTFLTSFEARNLALFTFCFLANIFKAMLRISCTSVPSSSSSATVVGPALPGDTRLRITFCIHAAVADMPR
jgi:hypothetical protein